MSLIGNSQEDGAKLTKSKQSNIAYIDAAILTIPQNYNDVK
jgi:hypothetical protein